MQALKLPHKRSRYHQLGLQSHACLALEASAQGREDVTQPVTSEQLDQTTTQVSALPWSIFKEAHTTKQMQDEVAC